MTHLIFGLSQKTLPQVSSSWNGLAIHSSINHSYGTRFLNRHTDMNLEREIMFSKNKKYIDVQNT